MESPEMTTQAVQPQRNVISEEREIKTRIVDGVLRALIFLGFFAAAAGSYNDYLNEVYFTIPIYWLAYGTVLFVALWKGISYQVRAWTIVVLFYGIGLVDLLSDGGAGNGKTFLVIFPLAAALFLGSREGLISIAVTILTFGGIGALFLSGQRVAPPVDPTNLSGWISGGFIYLLLSSFAVVSINYLIPQLTGALRQTRRLAGELDEERAGLEDQVRDRTNELEKRRVQLETASRIARDTAEIQELDVLLNQAVNLISDRFGFYHTGIFLNDERGDYAVLRAASSTGGKLMLERNHRLGIGREGIVGYVTGTGEARVALDVGEDAVFFDNPDLPETRSEMALPLGTRGEIIGALDVQSTEQEAFTSEDVEIIQTLADQLAVAISNARLFEQAESALEATRRAYGELSLQAWEKRIQERENPGYYCDRGGVSILESDQLPVDQEDSSVAIPLTIRGRMIGTIKAYKPKNKPDWGEDEVNFIQTLTERMGEALESARLFQDTQQRALQEQITAQVSSQIRRSLDMETVLKTAAVEIRRALDLEDTIIQLVPPEHETPNVGENHG